MDGSADPRSVQLRAAAPKHRGTAAEAAVRAARATAQCIRPPTSGNLYEYRL